MKKRNYRFLTLMLSLGLVACGVIGSTMAWLIDDTDTVVNTFTYGDINLDLEETKTDEKGNPVDENQDGEPDKTKEGNEYEMMPGEEYFKDPMVTVKAKNEACWLFVELEKIGGVEFDVGDAENVQHGIASEFDTYLKYAIADGWTLLTDSEGNPIYTEETDNGKTIYFRYVQEDTDNTAESYYILKDNKISVPAEITKEQLNLLDKKKGHTYGEGLITSVKQPELHITAYAIQYSGFEAEISDGAQGPSAEQMNTAALEAWRTIEGQMPPKG